MECPEFLTRRPEIHHSAFVAANATLLGDVTIDEYASVWFAAVLRADIQQIRIGAGSNVQDGTVIHLSSTQGVDVGKYVTIGHRAIIHACTIADEVLVGMGAIVMDGSVIGEHSIIGAGALVTMGQTIPPGSLVLGSPAKVVRSLYTEERLGIRKSAEKYIHVARFHREHMAEGS
ncbi:MAG: carbonic anhydrase/acetyltransferase-like protein (isoleucine patch superfamily) [Verrucomicrobiales bacterium]|jgi:carbonic anhydrase/acetyltransferase-like protein (isoleucine patch superfamily)